ncbi:glycerate kinase type-2 family protein [Marinomonas algicola]|uniref:glycerate kinase type-2 family protein n=1 Tax=Marinomonas algicola TaxID=2773454 RepID=UPI00174C7711|nr:glycerate kinase [Marinomonas algicola]
MMTPEHFLNELFNVAVRKAHPDDGLLAALSTVPATIGGRTVILGAGKAAAAMASIAENYFKGRVEGVVVTPYQHGCETHTVEVVEAAHPVPDQAGQIVARKMLTLVKGLTESDRVIFLVSGGGSSLLVLPPEEVELAEKQSINKQLLRSGASIDEINCVRKKLSQIKGGRLALHCSPATVHTFAISDVPGDAPSVIASGPTVQDDTSIKDAFEVLSRYEIQVSETVMAYLNMQQEKALDWSSLSEQNSYTIIRTPQMSLDAAAEFAVAQGITPIILGDLEGESRDVAKVHAGITRQIIKYNQPCKMPCVILSGGETTVTVKGRGRGGRNAEFLLALTLDLKGEKGVSALACDTDGIDGSEDNAGAIMLESTYQRALDKRLSPRAYLENNDGYSFFETLGGLIMTAPTRTNVNDFRAILIQP